MWKNERDPITNFGQWLQDEGIVDADELGLIADRVTSEASEAVAYAIAAAYPSTTEVDSHVFVA
jgi:pyruvate dehydrogenase E1 component alpha subunit